MGITVGTLYGIGIGPGDPELITVKGARLLSECRHVFVPRAPLGEESLALTIARRHIPAECSVSVFDFPLTRDREELRRVWNHVAGEVAAVLNTGSDVCYLTLGDTLLYSTYIYMVHALRQLLPDAQVVTIPGITAFSAAAAISAFAVGAGEETVTIVPATDDLASVKRALAFGGTVVIMKVGNRLRGVVELLERKGFLDRAVFVARAGLAGERMETDLRRLQSGTPDEGNLSVILVNAAMENDG